jgi:hypothetical protein
METLELSPGAKRTFSWNYKKFKFTGNKPGEAQAVALKKLALKKIKINWFAEDSPENLSTAEAAIRGGLVVLIPILSAIDWNYGTHSMAFIAPVILYLEVTAFTMFCPIKALFSNYSHPSSYE